MEWLGFPRASITLGDGQQCRFAGRNKSMLASTRATCETWRKISTKNRERTMLGRPRHLAAVIAFAAAALIATAASAQKKYDSGASDTEIRIGNIMPYSGPASS
jgi:hypothetical protein